MRLQKHLAESWHTAGAPKHLFLGSESSSEAQELRKEFPSIKQRFSDTQGLQALPPTPGAGAARGQSFPKGCNWTL